MAAFSKSATIGKLLQYYCNGQKSVARKSCKTFCSGFFWGVLQHFVATAIEPISGSDYIFLKLIMLSLSLESRTQKMKKRNLAS